MLILRVRARVRVCVCSANLQEDLQSPDEASLPFSEFLVIPPGSSTQVLAAAKMPEFVLRDRKSTRLNSSH